MFGQSSSKWTSQFSLKMGKIGFGTYFLSENFFFHVTDLICIKHRKKNIFIGIKAILWNAWYDEGFEESEGYAKGKLCEKKRKVIRNSQEKVKLNWKWNIFILLYLIRFEQYLYDHSNKNTESVGKVESSWFKNIITN